MKIFPVQGVCLTKSAAFNSGPSPRETPQQSIRPCDTLSSAEEPEGCCAWVVSLVIGVFKALWSFCSCCFGSEQSDEVEPSRTEWKIPDMSDMIDVQKDPLLMWVNIQEQNGQVKISCIDLTQSVAPKEEAEAAIKKFQDEGCAIISVHCFSFQIFCPDGEIKIFQKWITNENLQLIRRAEDVIPYKFDKDDNGNLVFPNSLAPRGISALGVILTFTIRKYQLSWAPILEWWLVKKMLEWVVDNC
jgi:hypothetical protein